MQLFPYDNPLDRGTNAVCSPNGTMYYSSFHNQLRVCSGSKWGSVNSSQNKDDYGSMAVRYVSQWYTSGNPEILNGKLYGFIGEQKTDTTNQYQGGIGIVSGADLAAPVFWSYDKSPILFINKQFDSKVQDASITAAPGTGGSRLLMSIMGREGNVGIGTDLPKDGSPNNKPSNLDVNDIWLRSVGVSGQWLSTLIGAGAGTGGGSSSGELGWYSNNMMGMGSWRPCSSGLPMPQPPAIVAQFKCDSMGKHCWSGVDITSGVTFIACTANGAEACICY
ncbi:MAG: hypothetical protein V1650_00360 [Candidatus Omnitrophota bacterium]